MNKTRCCFLRPQHIEELCYESGAFVRPLCGRWESNPLNGDAQKRNKF